jgi:hypothetical protein
MTSVCCHFQEKAEKQDIAEKAYNAWREGKKDFVSEKTKKKLEEEKKEKKKEEERKQKKEEAELVIIIFILLLPACEKRRCRVSVFLPDCSSNDCL